MDISGIRCQRMGCIYGPAASFREHRTFRFQGFYCPSKVGLIMVTVRASVMNINTRRRLRGVMEVKLQVFSCSTLFRTVVSFTLWLLHPSRNETFTYQYKSSYLFSCHDKEKKFRRSRPN
jgi:hypothetical protein